MKKRQTKLTLSKETLRKLLDESLREVAAGATQVCTEPCVSFTNCSETC